VSLEGHLYISVSNCHIVEIAAFSLIYINVLLTRKNEYEVRDFALKVHKHICFMQIIFMHSLKLDFVLRAS
jgi:hypothetical protein